LLTENQHRDFIKGDQAAFKEIYKDYKAFVFGISLRYTRCKDDAQDVFQETFIKIYEKRESYNPKYPLPPWIRQITVNSALLYIRKNYHLLLTDNEGHLEMTDESTFEKEDLSLLKKKLLVIMNQLPEGYKVVFNLFVIDNLTHKEIAQYLNISESTSRSQLHKAKKMITKLVENYNYE
jgi:RNA polymerase sigma factor (sigma-70 family)